MGWILATGGGSPSMLRLGEEHTSRKHGIFSKSVAQAVPHFHQSPLLHVLLERKGPLASGLQSGSRHPYQSKGPSRSGTLQKVPCFPGEDPRIVGGYLEPALPARAAFSDLESNRDRAGLQVMAA